MKTATSATSWELCRLGDLLVEEDLRVRDLEGGDAEVLSLTKRYGLIPQSERFEKRVATANIDNYKVVKQGWIAYNPYVIWEGAIHALRRTTPGAVSPAYVVWQPVDDDGGFVDYLLRRPEVIRVYESLSAGAVNRRRSIKKTAFKEIMVPCPPLEVRRKIAAALGSVRAAVDIQVRLRNLSVEARNAFLDRAVTGGLSPDRVRRPSELGDLPSSWAVAPISELARSIDYGTSVKCSYDPVGALPVLRIPNVVDGFIDLSDLKFGQPKKNEVEKLTLRVGDLLFVRTNGAQANAGRCAMFDEDDRQSYLFASYLIRVRVDEERVLSSFVNEYARSRLGTSFLSGRAVRTADGKFNINTGTLKAMVLPVPPLEEQALIVSELAKFDRKIKFHEQSRASYAALFEALLDALATGEVVLPDTYAPEAEAVYG